MDPASGFALSDEYGAHHDETPINRHTCYVQKTRITLDTIAGTMCSILGLLVPSTSIGVPLPLRAFFASASGLLRPNLRPRRPNTGFTTRLYKIQYNG